MRILIISKYFPPENSIASLRPYSWAKYWTKMGNQVEVLTTIKDKIRPEAIHLDTSAFRVNEIDFSSFYYALRSVYKREGFAKTAPEDTNYFDKEVSTSTNLPPKKKSGEFLKIDEWRKKRGLFLTARMPDVMDLWIKPATRWARDNGPWDLVVSTHGPYACHLIALNLKKENLCKYWIADFRDLWTENHIYKGLFPFTLAEKYFEKKIVEQADFVTTVSEPLAQTLRKKYGQENIRVIENGFDSEEFKDLPEGKIFRDNKVRIIQTGTIYPGKMSPALLFRAISSIAADSNLVPLLNNFEVLFLGPDNSLIMAEAEEMKVSDWVKDGGFLSRKYILKMQHEAHVVLFLGFDKNKTPGILSGKLFEYLFSNTPIWALDIDNSTDVGQIILQANAGILFGEDGDLLKNELIKLLQNPAKEQTCTNKLYLQQFERSNLAYKMLGLINTQNS